MLTSTSLVHPLVLAVAVVLAVAALVGVWRTGQLSQIAKVVWTAGVLVIPVVAPLIWFLSSAMRGLRQRKSSV